MKFRGATVICPDCGNRWNAEEVEFINIEEDIQGYDVMTFICPECDEKEVKSHVRA